MKILHVAESLMGGIASHIEEVVPRQIEVFGRDAVRILVPSDHLSALGAEWTPHVVPFARTRRGLPGLLSLARAYRSVAADWKPDLVHIHSTFAGATVRALLLFSTARPKVVYCPHGWAFLQEVPGWKKALYAGAERLLAGVTDEIVNVSHYETRLAAEWGFPRHKLSTVPNGISAESPRGDTRPQLVEGALNLLFVGRLDRQKGIEFLIEAARDLVDEPVHFHIVGSGVLTDGGTDWTALGLPNTTFYGWISRRDVFAYMEACDAVVMPSRWEGLPIAALEAMRLARPLITSDRCSFPEVVIDHETGRLFPMDVPGSLARVIREFRIEDGAAMGRAARAHFLANYTSDRQAQSLIDIYRKCMDDRRIATPSPTPDHRPT